MFSKLSPHGYIRVRAQDFDNLPTIISEPQIRTIIYYELLSADKTHNYCVCRSVLKIDRRNSRKTAETLNCPLSVWQCATTRCFGYPPKDHKARLASGHPLIVFAGPRSIRLPFAPSFKASSTREKNRQRRRPKNSSRRLLSVTVSWILGAGHQQFAQ